MHFASLILVLRSVFSYHGTEAWMAHLGGVCLHACYFVELLIVENKNNQGQTHVQEPRRGLRMLVYGCLCVAAE